MINNTITGTEFRDALFGINGFNNLIDGLGGDDDLLGGDGNDMLLGGDGNDNLNGGGGNDILNPGDNNPDIGDFISGSTGNDTIIYTDNIVGFQGLGYFLDAAITVTINGITNTATVDKGVNGFDTIVDINSPLIAGWTTGGFGIIGTNRNDTFNIIQSGETWMQVRGRADDDTFNITLDGGVVRVDYRDGVHGVNVNLATGVVSDDGFGSTDTINRTGNGLLEIRGSDFADTILGSSANDSFVLRAGDDTLDGGAGFDRVRYDRGGVQAVDVDLAAGTATGIWNGVAFSDSLTGIEHVRGSRNDADTISGDGFANLLDGRGGNDTLNGRGGKDTLLGDDGNDRLIGGAGNDLMGGDNGRDKLIGGGGKDTLLGGAGKDRLLGNGGNDILNGGKGNDRLVGGNGADDFIFAGRFGKDTITDFNALSNNEDIDLSGVRQIKSWNDLSNNHMTQVGLDVVITQGANTLTLLDVDIDDLGRGDFLF